MSKRRIVRISLIAAALSLLLLLFAPYPSAERYRERVELGLERLLQRDVSIGEMRFTLWGGPGFVLTNVVISDLPSVSAEPFAYVSEARVGVAFSSVWRGELVFSSILLTQPSVNIAQDVAGTWNYESMLRRGVGSGKQSAGGLPELVVREGRINFRNGLKKSIYYFRNADLRLAEEGRGTDAWLVEFRAEPARTDSYAPRFGTVRGRGRWRAAAGRNGELDLDLEIERSPLSEIASLFRASRAGLSGFLTVRAHLSGPAESIELRGVLELSERGEWGLFALPGQTASVPLRGSLDLPAQRLHLEVIPSPEAISDTEGAAAVAESKNTEPLGSSDEGGTPPSAAPGSALSETAPSPPEDARFEAAIDLNPASAPGQWLARVAFEQLPVAQVIGLLRYLDDSFPEYPQLEGALSGEVNYRSAEGLLGTATGERLVWREDDRSPFSLSQMNFRVQGDEVDGHGLLELSPDVASSPTANAPAFDFSLDRQSGRLYVSLESRSLSARDFAAIRQIAPAVGERLSFLEGDRWRASGSASWQRNDFRDSGGWFAQLLVRGLTVPVSGITSPVVFESLPLNLRGEAWKISGARARVDGIRFKLDVSQNPGTLPGLSATRPIAMRIDFDELSLSELASQLRIPQKPSRGFLSRTFSLREESTPPWLRNLSLAAKINIKKVLIENSKYEDLSGDLYWDGTVVEFRNISIRSRFGLFRSRLHGELWGATPVWTWKSMGSRLPWRGGEIDFEADYSATGSLAGILARAGGAMEISWRRPALSEGADGSLLRASLIWNPGAEEPTICADCVEFRSGGDVFIGTCRRSNGTGYQCPVEDPRTGQKREINLPISMVGLGAN